MSAHSVDPRREDRIIRYKQSFLDNTGCYADDQTPDYMNVFSMLLAMYGLLFKVKWASWVALVLASISFANSRITDDGKQLISTFMLSFSSVIMSYMQNPVPMTLPFT